MRSYLLSLGSELTGRGWHLVNGVRERAVNGIDSQQNMAGLVVLGAVRDEDCYRINRRRKSDQWEWPTF